MRNNSHFKKGTFKCDSCGKLTRHAGENDGTELCPLCEAKASCGNTISDCTSLKNPWKLFDECTTVAECYSLCDKLMGENQ